MIVLSRPVRCRRAALIAAFVLVTGVVAPAAAIAAGTANVKYYVVASQYNGAPENLSEISTRFLGTPDRATDILALNKGRVQPDGGQLSDANALHAGWDVVLPWDAAGTGVINGPLPAAPTYRPPTPSAGKPYPTPAATKTTPALKPTARGCAGAQDPSTHVNQGWAQARLAPEQAWSHGRGNGVTVAIIDSGVDASVPALSGRITAGADIVTGTGRGDVDCLGTGTAMAGLIVADTGQGAQITGVAPSALVMPVRITTNAPAAGAADQASAIDVAVQAGVGVIALGSYVDIALPAVRDAVERAAQHDVVVVVGASATQPIAGLDQLLRVGAMGIDGKLGQTYAPGGVDVVAPGVNVTSVGISGTGTFVGSGTQYAVALVAGQAALIRSAYPAIAADEVAARIRTTSVALDPGPRPSDSSGWGLIDLGASTQPVAANAATGPAVSTLSSGRSASRTVLWVAIVVAAVIGLVFILRIRRAVRAGAPDETGELGPALGRGRDRPTEELDLSDRRRNRVPAAPDAELGEVSTYRGQVR